ncbi:PAS domain-containing sensor histidine kinase [Lutibacter sp.]|uniref:PAS domain-containing sensor histidine kinase n=1 Tax=Lutibacter sp. TaxID=1925666 RepID=UPI001A3354D2|nr:PAS domain-containing sensor histidine kinase [Lutibacter sp.]MBI9041318.1 PAS domain-containing sensor histidine kinase [Lutibacter sp.]
MIHLNDVPDTAIVICTTQGVICTANTRFCEITGMELAALTGEQLSLTFFSKVGILQTACNLHKLLSGEVHCKELTFIKEDASVLNFELKAQVLADHQIGFFLKDITVQKNTHAKLQEVTDRLEVLNEDKSRFISVLAHDLKSPFNTILGFISLLKENIEICNKEEVERYISYVEITSKNTFHLLEDTLEWISAERGTLNITKGTCVLNTLITEVLQHFHLIAKAKNITIYVHKAPKVSLLCDANMIKTVLRNLVSNAIKFTNRNGEIHINLTGSATEASIIIRDTGIGISEKAQAELFQMQQFHSTVGTDHEKGTGMGLLLCKEFISKHQGTLTIQSQEGVGSTFTVTIPILEKEIAEN